MREQKEKSLFHSLCEDVEKHKGISVPMRRFRLKSYWIPKNWTSISSLEALVFCFQVSLC